MSTAVQFERSRPRPLLQAAIDCLIGAGPQCPAFIRHGPGHQSTTRCQVKGLHEIHEALYGNDESLARWTESEACTGSFDVLQGDEPGEDKLRRTLEEELIEALRVEIARAGGEA